MELSNNNINVDGFRFINHLNTTSRQLFICSEIVRKLGAKQTPKEILSQLLTNWSRELETESDVYKNSRGKLTEKGIATTALTHYLQLTNSLRLISNLNNFYSNTRLANVLLYFKDKKNQPQEPLAIGEKLFYLFQLFSIDADGIIFVLSLLSEGEISQSQLQKIFKDRFNDRLMVKKDLASDIIKEEISEKYRMVNFVWQNAQKYSEHLLIPRCEWLYSLGVISIKKENNFTKYSLNEKGQYLYDALPFLGNTSTKDINENWMINNLFYHFNSLYLNSRCENYSALNYQDKLSLLGALLEKSNNVVKATSSFRMPLFDSLLFVCIEMCTENAVIINFSDILDALKGGLLYNGKQYSLSEAARINESYIAIRIIE